MEDDQKIEDSESESEFWSAYRAHQKKKHEAWRSRVQPIVSERMDQLRRLGYSVREITEWQYRVNGRIDIYWQSKRWHDIKKNTRGSYLYLVGFIKENLPDPKSSDRTGADQ